MRVERKGEGAEAQAPLPLIYTPTPAISRACLTLPALPLWAHRPLGQEGKGLACAAHPSGPVSHRDNVCPWGLSPTQPWAVPGSICVLPALGTHDLMRPEVGLLPLLLLSQALAQPSLPKPHPCPQHTL